MVDEANTPDMENALTTLATLAENASTIPRELYQTYEVKRGLRNSDGTGVLVGLTRIGNVHGYVIDEREKTAVPGGLYYRGYEVGDLLKGYKQEGRLGFEEVCYLLLFGDLPTGDQLAEFEELLGHYRILPANFTEDMILKLPSPNIMNKLARSILVSYSSDPNPDDISIQNVVRQCIKLIAQLPTMTAYGYQARNHYYKGKSLFIHNPEPGLSTAENLLRMIRPTASFTALEAEILDMSLILHAEHGGGNNSAFTVHVVSSSDTDTYSALAAAVGSLKGPKHGGANNHIRMMVEDLKKSVDWRSKEDVRRYLEAIVEKKAFDKKGLIYGMGHAVYTISDPRAILLCKKAEELASELGREDELQLYNWIEELSPGVLNEKRGREAPICANVDLYSGLVYDMLGIPPELYTPLFAISRMPGWCAHRIEELVSGGKIIRPACKSVVKSRTYVPMADRTA
jgi:citrate synthase